jgi:transposase-like protein
VPGISKRQFTHEYHAEAVKLVAEQGVSLTVAARKLSLSVRAYANWWAKPAKASSHASMRIACKHSLPVAPNLLEQRFNQTTAPNLGTGDQCYRCYLCDHHQGFV